MTIEQIQALAAKGEAGKHLARRIHIMQDALDNLAALASHSIDAPEHLADWAESVERNTPTLIVAIHAFIIERKGGR